MKKPGETWGGSFQLTGAPTGSVTAVLRNEGVTDGAVSVTITAITTTDYRFSVTTPAYADGAEIEVVATATVAGVTQSSAVARTTVNTSRAADVIAAINLAQMAATVVTDEANSTTVFTVSGLTVGVASLIGMGVEFTGGTAGNLKARQTITAAAINGSNVRLTIGNALAAIPAGGDTVSIF